MKLYYVEGPEQVVMGAAGEFKRGEVKEVDDALGKQLIAKQSLQFLVAGED